MYVAIFFSIVACAGLVSVVERGALDPLPRHWLAKFPPRVESAATEPTAGEAATLSPLAPPDLQEPNPIREL